MSLAQLDLSEFIGEIVESSTSQFTSESRELNGAPPFGSFVKTLGALPVYGLVFNVCTHSIEPNRRATAYGLTEQQLREEQPQIFELLKTEFEAVIIGYGDDKGPQQVLPPATARHPQFCVSLLGIRDQSPDQQRRFSPQHFVRQWQSPARGRSHHRLGAKCLGRACV